MYALKWMFPTILILGVIIGVMYVYIGFANVTTVDITAPLIQVDPLQTQILFNQSFYNYTTFCPTPTSCVMGVNTVPVKVSIMIYMIALVSFAGWLVFIVFAGVGLVTLPMDFLVAFKYRPRNISTAQYEEGKKIIGEAATRLMKVRDELKAQKLELRKSGTSGFTRKDRQYTNRENNFKKVCTRFFASVSCRF
jgi:LMBR1 domain-containing protein 1